MAEMFNLLVILSLIIAVFVIVFSLFRLIFLIKKEKRVTRFSISSISDSDDYLFDKILDKYINFTKNFSKKLKRSTFLNSYSKRYEKYIINSNREDTEGMDYVATKFIISFMVVIITIVSDVLRGQSISFTQLVLSFAIGFFILDIFLFIENRRRHKQFEDDVLKAVIIMNNAFRSGRSIMQAIDLVSKELTGPVSDEFKKMSLDLSYGLDLEVVFKRFAERVNLEEVNYMASSLIIINKTGGNVVQVFSSIEKSFLSRKKLKDELNSTTALSRLVYKILVAMPIFIFVLIYIINPSYFAPYITTFIGRIILVIILVLYLLYIIMIKTVTKARDW